MIGDKCLRSEIDEFYQLLHLRRDHATKLVSPLPWAPGAFSLIHASFTFNKMAYTSMRRELTITGPAGIALLAVRIGSYARQQRTQENWEWYNRWSEIYDEDYMLELLADALAPELIPTLHDAEWLFKSLIHFAMTRAD